MQGYFGQEVLLGAVFVCAFVATLVTLGRILPKHKAAGFTGKDMHKEGMPEVVEMGGIAVVVGMVGASLLGIGIWTLFGFDFYRLHGILAALITVLIIAIIGIFDDLFEMAQKTKALLPLAAAVPLIAVEVAAGNNSIFLPIFGPVDFGLLYPIALIPLAIAVCSNLTNMLAGFNGIEAGMGAIIFAAMSFIALTNGQLELAILSMAMLGALLGFLPSNMFPAKAFMGDVGALLIGAVLAAGVIISPLKSAGAIMMIPYIVDFFIKASAGFPKSFAELRNGKLHAPKGKVRGLADVILSVSGGMSEKRLVYAFYFIEAAFALVAIALYAKF